MSGAALEAERARARLLDRAADPERMLCGVEQRLAAVGLVEQHAEAGPPVGDPRRGRDGEALEGGDPLARRAGGVGHRLELGAMVDGERDQRVGLRRGASSPSGCGSAPRRGGARDAGCPSSRKVCSSGQVGYSGEQSRRDTAKAPQAFAQVGRRSRAARRAASRAGSRP